MPTCMMCDGSGGASAMQTSSFGAHRLSSMRHLGSTHKELLRDGETADAPNSFEPGLLLDDVVNLKHFRLPRVDPHVGEDRPQPLPECIEVLLRIPYLADLEVILRA